MVRVPLRGERAEFVMTRRGSISAQLFESATGFPVRMLESVASASSQPGLSQEELDSRVRAFSSQRTALTMRR
jgi:hypothetical protein